MDGPGPPRLGRESSTVPSLSDRETNSFLTDRRRFPRQRPWDRTDPSGRRVTIRLAPSTVKPAL